MVMEVHKHACLKINGWIEGCRHFFFITVSTSPAACISKKKPACLVQRSSSKQTETHVFPRNSKYRSLHKSGLLSFCSDYKALNGFLVTLLIVNCYK